MNNQVECPWEVEPVSEDIRQSLPFLDDFEIGWATGDKIQEAHDLCLFGWSSGAVDKDDAWWFLYIWMFTNPRIVLMHIMFYLSKNIIILYFAKCKISLTILFKIRPNRKPIKIWVNESHHKFNELNRIFNKKNI